MLLLPRSIAKGDLQADQVQLRLKPLLEVRSHNFIVALPKVTTLLGKWFAKGTNLSGGGYNALPRAFLRRAQIVSDEPTSAMDSWAEADWHRFRTLANGRTAPSSLIVSPGDACRHNSRYAQCDCGIR